MKGRFSPKSALLFALVTLMSVNFGFGQSSNRRPLSKKKALSSLHCLQHIKNSGLLEINGGAKDKWKFRGSELPIMTSKTYAQFETSTVETDFIQTYSLEILLNKYQITPNAKPITLRSTSLFYVIPHIRSKHKLASNGVVEIEYQAGLKMASNSQVESNVEDMEPRKINWIGKVALKWNLGRWVKTNRSLSK